MIAPSVSPAAPASGTLATALLHQGFVPDAACFRRGRLTFRREGRWAVFSVPLTNGRNRVGAAGWPGLWKRDDRGGSDRLLFQIPHELLTGATCVADPLDCEAGGVEHLMDACLRWPLVTLAGEVGHAWSPPGEEQVAEWLDADRFTIRHGAVLRQVDVVREAGSFALRVPLLEPVPDDLPEPRRCWLDRLLADVCNQWRLIRAGVAPDGSVLAEVDLTGAPESICAVLVPAGVESLRWVVDAVVEVGQCIVDPDPACRIFDSPPHKRMDVTKQEKGMKQDG